MYSSFAIPDVLMCSSTPLEVSLVNDDVIIVRKTHQLQAWWMTTCCTRSLVILPISVLPLTCGVEGGDERSLDYLRLSYNVSCCFSVFSFYVSSVKQGYSHLCTSSSAGLNIYSCGSFSLHWSGQLLQCEYEYHTDIFSGFMRRRRFSWICM